MACVKGARQANNRMQAAVGATVSHRTETVRARPPRLMRSVRRTSRRDYEDGHGSVADLNGNDPRWL